MEPIFKSSIFGFKVLLFSNFLSFKGGLFGKEITIPLEQIASIEADMPGVQQIIVETTGGAKVKILVRLKDKKDLINAIYAAKANKK